jgi:hypothetical protein
MNHQVRVWLVIFWGKFRWRPHRPVGAAANGIIAIAPNFLLTSRRCAIRQNSLEAFV